MSKYASPEYKAPIETDCGDPDFTKGCIICGWKNENLANMGLERAHIFADGAVSNLTWNLVPLCTRCHDSFDALLKPRISKAFEVAMKGFYPDPQNKLIPQKQFSAQALLDALK